MVKSNFDRLLALAAILLWVGVIFAVILKAVQIETISEEARSVFPLFYNSGKAWSQGECVYYGVCKSYLYWPGFAGMVSLISGLSFHTSILIWIAISVCTILIATGLLGWTVFENTRSVWILYILSAPLAFEGLYNHQSNALLYGILLIGAVLVYREWYWVGSILMMIAAFSKIAPLSLMFLILIIYPKELWWRYLVVGVGVFLFPFILGESGYVLGQYNVWISILTENVSERWAYRDLWTIYELLSRGSLADQAAAGWYRAIQLLIALCMAFICAWQKYYLRYSKRSMITSAVICASSWWLLAGPSTEIATCIIAAGVAGIGAILAWRANTAKWLAILAYICISIGCIGDYEYHMYSAFQSDWVKVLLPTGSLMIFIWVCLYLSKSLALTTEKKDVRYSNH